MQLPDGPRQIVAAILGSAGFLALYLGLGLVWWAALGLAVVLYGAGLLVIGRKPPETEIMVAARISAADLRSAKTSLERAAGEIEQVAQSVPGQTAQALGTMAADLRAIADHVYNDPEDYRKTRRFVQHFLPHMQQTIQSYGALAGKAAASDRLAAIGTRIEHYAPVVHRINLACLENDFEALELEVNTLETQLSRRIR